MNVRTSAKKQQYSKCCKQLTDPTTLKLLLDLEPICTNIARVFDNHMIDGSLNTKIDEGRIWAGVEVLMDRGGGLSIGRGECGRGGGPTGVMEESEGMVGALESKPNALFECSMTAGHINSALILAIWCLGDAESGRCECITGWKKELGIWGLHNEVGT
ncbi:uncharacterized protein BJ212DRAFT_1304779 [Suillus subaureus]|uniref:Uncharacterized protein n=1 Tax=Suillus subaureus TaxID=48587 RepID=A0A9P7J4P5_9AGAM|nr:uncharacterized protein BJ212DRAFT_1304779 [Suillus subaureus]KAG1802553.1 hypothetical protein BJ212DRAFT_1304779 [Suillus subaureus]